MPKSKDEGLTIEWWLGVGLHALDEYSEKAYGKPVAFISDDSAYIGKYDAATGRPINATLIRSPSSPSLASNMKVRFAPRSRHYSKPALASSIGSSFLSRPISYSTEWAIRTIS